jgi:hypothetical protein
MFMLLRMSGVIETVSVLDFWPEPDSRNKRRHSSQQGKTSWESGRGFPQMEQLIG